MDVDKITQQIIKSAYYVHNTLGAGFLEKVYENALFVELIESGLDVNQQHPINIYYKEKLVGEYYADLLVENKVIVEIKAVNSMVQGHEVQLVNYLNGAKIDDGLLINFAKSVEVLRKFRVYKNTKDGSVFRQD